jgi:hypothetical protein
MPADQKIPEIIKQLHHTEAYPHPVSEPIRLEQTHISYLLLTGKWAYKIKKTLDLRFLNFTSLQKRKYFLKKNWNVIVTLLWNYTVKYCRFSAIILANSGLGNSGKSRLNML